jgi:hypothetical protein
MQQFVASAVPENKWKCGLKQGYKPASAIFLELCFFEAGIAAKRDRTGAALLR